MGIGGALGRGATFSNVSSELRILTSDGEKPNVSQAIQESKRLTMPKVKQVKELASMKPKEVLDLEKDGWIPILRAGAFTSSSGDPAVFTQGDLQKIVDDYDPDVEEAPLVIGHPKTDDPAWGWVKSLKRSGDWLLMQTHKVAKEFKDAVNDGRFNKRSVSLVGSKLKHVGFLGAALPAVSGLGSAKLNASDDGQVIEFAVDANGVDRSLYWRLKECGQLFSNLREWIISQGGENGIATADRILPKYLIEDLNQDPPDPPSYRNSYSATEPESETQLEDTMPMTEAERKELDDAKAETERLKTELAAKEGEVTTLQTTLNAQTEAAWVTHRDDFCQKLIAEGKLLPANLGRAKKMLDMARSQGKGEFSQGKNADLDEVKQYFSSSPKVISVGSSPEGAPIAGAMDANDISIKAQEFVASEAKAGRSITVSDAVAHVMKQAQGT